MFKWYYQKLGKYGIEIKDKKTTKISKINQSIDEYYFRNLYGKSFSVQDNASRRSQYSKKTPHLSKFLNEFKFPLRYPHLHLSSLCVT